METLEIHGIITLYEIPEEWAIDDELFKACWPRLSEEAKAQRQAKEPVHNLFVTAGVNLFLANLSVAAQSQMFPITQILSVGNGAITGVLRSDTSVAGDGFATGARKAPVLYTPTLFITTIQTNFLSTDAVGTWTNLGFYGRNTSLNQDATTTTGTGALMTH